MTKPIASVALMQLYERGMFQLLDPVHRYIPEWRTLRSARSTRRLRLSGQAAAPDEHPRRAHAHDGAPGSSVPRQPHRRRVRRGPPGARTGRPSRGSPPCWPTPAEVPPGHALELRVVHRHRRPPGRDPVGQRFDEYLRREIFEPLGYGRHRFFVPETVAPPRRLLPVPAGHPPASWRPRSPRDPGPPAYLSGAGGLVSTTHDYVAFCQMLANGGHLDGRRVLGRKTLELMTVNHLPAGRPCRTWPSGVRRSRVRRCRLRARLRGRAGPGRDRVWRDRAPSLPGRRREHGLLDRPGGGPLRRLHDPALPLGAYPFRAQLRALVYQAIDD